MASDSSPDPDLEDDLVRQHAEQALEPYRDRLPPEDLEGFRTALILFYATHPDAVEALNQLRKQPTVARSGERARRDDEALKQAVTRKSSRGGPR